MNSKRWLGLLIFALCGITGTARGWDTPLNPDLRPFFGFQSGGGFDFDAQEATIRAKASQDETRDTADQTLNFFSEVLFPLTNHWSLQGGAGMISDHSTSDPTPLQAASDTDRTSVNASLSSRYYFIDHSIVSSPLKDNPDQCPSVAVTVSGTDSLYREQTDVTNGTSAPRVGGINQSLSITGDSRLPVSNAITLLINMTGTFTMGSTPQTPTANGSETREKTITYGGGLKYYWVGKNFITNDQHTNPDRWLSISFIADGISRVAGQAIATSATTGTDTRSTTSSGFTLSTEIRFPVTNNLSWRLGMSGGRTTGETPLTANSTGTNTTTPSFAGFAGIRAFFL